MATLQEHINNIYQALGVDPSSKIYNPTNIPAYKRDPLGWHLTNITALLASGSGGSLSPSFDNSQNVARLNQIEQKNISQDTALLALQTNIESLASQINALSSATSSSPLSTEGKMSRDLNMNGFVVDNVSNVNSEYVSFKNQLRPYHDNLQTGVLFVTPTGWQGDGLDEPSGDRQLASKGYVDEKLKIFQISSQSYTFQGISVSCSLFSNGIITYRISVLGASQAVSGGAYIGDVPSAYWPKDYFSIIISSSDGSFIGSISIASNGRVTNGRALPANLYLNESSATTIAYF